MSWRWVLCQSIDEAYILAGEWKITPLPWLEVKLGYRRKFRTIAVTTPIEKMRSYLTRIHIDGVKTIYIGKSSIYKDQELEIRRSSERFARLLLWRTGCDLEILLLTIRISMRKIFFFVGEMMMMMMISKVVRKFHRKQFRWSYKKVLAFLFLRAYIVHLSPQYKIV